jgi:hypothetical protein
MKLFAALAAITILTLALLWAYIELPPKSLRSVPIPTEFLSDLRSKHSDDLSDPLAASLLLLYWGASDPIDTTGMTIVVKKNDDGTRTVNIDDRHTQDDSVSRIYCSIRLRRDGSAWIPFERRFAQQGRGVFGWTTGPTN